MVTCPEEFEGPLSPSFNNRLAHQSRALPAIVERGRVRKRDDIRPRQLNPPGCIHQAVSQHNDRVGDHDDRVRSAAKGIPLDNADRWTPIGYHSSLRPGPGYGAIVVDLRPFQVGAAWQCRVNAALREDALLILPVGDALCIEGEARLVVLDVANQVHQSRVLVVLDTVSEDRDTLRWTESANPPADEGVPGATWLLDGIHPR